ncbi:vesicular-fusion protein S17 [Naganishia albida]|nr:vesicular-fusion protein S17 [Naganishia albida]
MSTEGDKLFAQATKKSQSSSGWFSSSSSKHEASADLYQQSANAYKAEQNFARAGEAFGREAEERVKQGDAQHEATQAWVNAGRAWKKVDPGRAVECLARAVQGLVKAGQFRQAADREKEIAQIWAQDNLNIAKARDSYVRAGEWYKQEEANATANQCYQAAAEHSADLGDFGRAIELYEQVGDWSLASPLTKYSVKEYWLRASLCAMAMGDLVTCNRLLTTFAQKDVTFPSTREYKLAAAVMDACEQGDVDSFTQAVYEYDQLTKLDNCKTGILLRIKKGLEMEMDGGLT